jgi:hypothetical protein
VRPAAVAAKAAASAAELDAGEDKLALLDRALALLGIVEQPPEPALGFESLQGEEQGYNRYGRGGNSYCRNPTLHEILPE